MAHFANDKILDLLPEVVWGRIFSFLSIPEMHTTRMVCRTFEHLLEYELNRMLNKQKDWRIDYIQNIKYKTTISPFEALNLFNNLKIKKSNFIQRKFTNCTGNLESLSPVSELNENLLITIRSDKGGVKEFRLEDRQKQTASTLSSGSRDRARIQDRSVVFAGLSDDGESMDIKEYNLSDSECKSYSIKPPKHALSQTEFFHRFQVNGEYILTTYTKEEDWNSSRRESELWKMGTSPVQLSLPDCNPHLTKDEKRMNCRWIMDMKEEILVAQFVYLSEYDGDSPDEFVLVYQGFNSPKFLHRIVLPVDCNSVDPASVRLTTVGEWGCTRTVLIARHFIQDLYQLHIFDVLTGVMAATGPRVNYDEDRYEYSDYQHVSGEYIFCALDISPSDVARGATTFYRITWNGKSYKVFDHDLSLPSDATECYATPSASTPTHALRLREITDTQVLWEVGENEQLWNHSDWNGLQDVPDDSFYMLHDEYLDEFFFKKTDCH